MQFVPLVALVKIHLIWIFFLIGLVVGLLLAVLSARYNYGSWFLESTFRALSVLLRSPRKAANMLRVWRENWHRRRMQSAALAKEIDALEGEIEELKGQIKGRKRKIREARWQARKP